MGLIGGLLTLPLAPVRGVVWVLEQVAYEAQRELYDEGRIRRQLAELEMAFELGEVTEEEYAHREDMLLQRLQTARELAAAEPALTEEAEVEPTIDLTEVGLEIDSTEVTPTVEVTELADGKAGGADHG